ncbi:hypothetical protein [Nannocystis radixulma]|uniref:Uncharacterized protein n=1 Tax=Nannocystis radixulma TaxID=2995305 RepID=A0ABT5BJD8_9BACT|nr:hypothetical protein [Nannocystis radixulma]MDC0674217.1 hypothetical protein [Nannocystis radixulma]
MPPEFDRWARWAYEQAIQREGHVQFDGLWKLGGQYFVVCPDPAARSSDGRPFAEWFMNSCRPMTSPVRLVMQAPPGSERVPERKLEDALLCRGSPRTHYDLVFDLSNAVPPDFPPFTVRDEPPHKIVITFAREISQEEEAVVRHAYEYIGVGFELIIEVDKNRRIPVNFSEIRPSSPGETNIDIIPGRWLGGDIGRSLRWMQEEDEEFWRSKRVPILENMSLTPSAALSVDWFNPGNSCVIDAAVGEYDNLRTYLSLYDRVLLALPLRERFSEALSGLGVNENELIELIQLGRVRLLLPHSIQRYPTKWLEAVAELAPGNMLLSRRLALATILDSRRRIPLLFPPLSPYERYLVLRGLTTMAEQMPASSIKDWMLRISRQLGQGWAAQEYTLSRRGALATSVWGLGALGAEMVEHMWGRDLRLEMWSASMGVEWSGLFGAHLFPRTLGEYDEAPACEMLANIYSVHGDSPVHVEQARTLSVVGGMLALDNKVPIVPFAREFSSSDIRRLRTVMRRLTSENMDEDFLRKAIDDYNVSIRQYERRPDRLKVVNLIGLTAAMITAFGLVEGPVRTYLPLMGAMLGPLLNVAIDEGPAKSESVGKIVDYLNGVLAGGVPPEAVLVARAKKQVKILKG